MPEHRAIAARAMTPEDARQQRDRAKRALDAMRSRSSDSPLARSGSFSNGERSDVCFDWSRGSCARGESCRFSHEGAAGANPQAGGGRVGSPHRAAAGVCFDYAKGTCKRGDMCRFSHDVAAVAAFTKIASTSGSPTGSPTNGGVGGPRVGTLNIPKPLPLAGALSAAAKPVPKQEPAPSPAPISQRSGAVDYASAAKAGVTTAGEGSFAAALVGKAVQVEPVVTAPLPPTPMPPTAEKPPALTASGASVPAPRFAATTTTNGAAPPPPLPPGGKVPPANVARPSFQFGTGSSMPLNDQSNGATTNGANGISFGNKAPAAPKPRYPKPEFAFGAGAVNGHGEGAVAPAMAEGFVPPMPAGPPPVPAGPPPQANQRQPTTTPGFDFAQPGFGIAAPQEKTTTHQGNVWGGNPHSNNGSLAAADGSSQLGTEWDVSGMGMESLAADFSNVGNYDALGGGSFASGLGYSLFAPTAMSQQNAAQGQSMWGDAHGSAFGGYGGF